MDLRVVITINEEENDSDRRGVELMAQAAIEGDLDALSQLVRLAAAGSPAVEITEVIPD